MDRKFVLWVGVAAVLVAGVYVVWHYNTTPKPLASPTPLVISEYSLNGIVKEKTATMLKLKFTQLDSEGNPEDVVSTFAINQDTPVQLLTKQNGQFQASPASAHYLHSGSNVTLYSTQDLAHAPGAPVTRIDIFQ